VRSLFAQYKEEREGKRVLEGDGFFVVYSIKPKSFCYLEDIFIVPDKRGSGLARDILGWIINIAKENDCKKIMGSVVPSANGSTESLKKMLHYGFKLSDSRDGIVFLAKDI
jgi:GNAT superfamily N-acetyltransferase